MTDKKAAQNDTVVQEAVSKVAEALVVFWCMSPALSLWCEAPDHDTCQKYVDEVVNVICEKGYKTA